MNVLDGLVVGLALLAAVGGYRIGFVTRTVSWLGMGIGLFAAARSLPWLFQQFEGSQPTTLVLLGGSALLIGSFLGQAAGLLVGSRVHVSLPNARWRDIDRSAGAVAGTIGVLASLWLLLPALADVPGTVSELSRNSIVARYVDRTLPEPPDTLLALRRLVGEDQFPRVFDALTPAPDIGPPPTDPGLPPEVIAAVTPSTVKIEGIACRRVQEGSGFVTVASDLVVTNAHVVSGIDEPTVERDDGERLDAFVVVFDPDRDLAILRVPGLTRQPLELQEAGTGTTGGVFGHPGGAPLRVAPFQVGDEVIATGTDIYDSKRTERQVLVLAASLRPGDSGSALIDAAGVVVGVAFAIAPDDPNVAYALAIEELRAVLAGDLSTPVDTGSCLR